MTRIYKYPLQPMGGVQSIEMPQGADILSVQAQNDRPTLWAAVNPDAPMESRRFVTAITGALIPDKEDEAIYLGTVQLAEGTFVLHVFEVTR